MWKCLSASLNKGQKKKGKKKTKLFIGTGNIGGNFFQNILKKQIIVPGCWFSI